MNKNVYGNICNCLKRRDEPTEFQRRVGYFLESCKAAQCRHNNDWLDVLIVRDPLPTVQQHVTKGHPIAGLSYKLQVSPRLSTYQQDQIRLDIKAGFQANLRSYRNVNQAQLTSLGKFGKLPFLISIFQ